MMHWLKRFLVLALIALMTVGIYAASQTIEGVVKDNTGGIIPGVTVTLTNTDTGATRQALTNDEGYFVFNNIPTGNYELKSTLEGFQPVKIGGIIVHVGDKLNYPITMKVSELKTELEVKAEVQQVQTTTSQLDQVIDEKRITDLPLNGRNPLNLIYLTPGVTSGPVGPSANGARERGNNYQIDGVDNNDTAVIGEVVDTNVDATAEFRVVTSNPSAEYGRSGGAIIDVITKSGTNDFHGNVFWFHRNDNLDAATWRENYYGLDKGEFKRNQIGASFGGPVVKDKLFFFFNTQIERYRSFAPMTANVPTQAFRDTVTNADIANVFNTYYPLPNTDPSNAEVPGVDGYYAYGSNDPYDGEQYTFKVDYNFSENHTFFVRYYYNHFKDDNPWVLPTTPLGTFPSEGHTHSIALDWTWIVSPTLVNDARLGFNRLNSGWFRQGEVQGGDLVFGGWLSDPTYYFTDFGGPWGYGDQYRHTGTLELKDTVTWTKSTHNIKFGIDFRFSHDNGATNFSVIPAFFFDPYYFSGNSLDNIRTGFVDYVYQAIYSNGQEYIPGLEDYRGWREHEYDFFVQDDWKITPNLTLNLGLRYEWKPPAYEVNGLSSNVHTNEMVSNGYHIPNMDNFFDPANWQGGAWWNLVVDHWVGTGADIYLAGRNRDADLYDAPKTNFAPRLGFSWDPWGDGKTAVRGGYGISYDRLFDNLLSWNTGQVPFGTYQLTPGAMGSYNGVWPNGTAYFGHGTPIPAIKLHLDPESFETMVLYNEDFKQPYIQTWNFSIQREIWPGNILTLTYAGSSGVHLLSRGNPNQMHHPSAETIQGLNDNIGETGSIPWYVRYYSFPNTQFYRIHFIDEYAHSRYDSFQLSFSHRYQNGLQFQLNYTYGKAYDNSSESVYTEGGSSPFASDWYNRDYDRGYSAFDIRHNFNANFIYELPFGPGKWLGGDTEGILGQIIGGWQINGIVYANTGYPMDYKVPRDTLGTGYTNARAPARPDVVSYTVNSNQNLVGPTQDNFLWDSDHINLLHPQGNYYRGMMRGPSYFDVDFSIFKEVKTPWFTSEGAKIQFRAEFFNLFNHTNFTLPSRSFTSANMGKTFSANANRQIQLGLKFIF